MASSTSPSSARTSDDLFDSSFRLPSFDGTPTSTSTTTTTTTTKSQPTQYCRPTANNATNVPSILVSTPNLSSPSSPPPAPNTSRSLRSRFSIGRDSPSSTPSYLQPNQPKHHHLSATPSLNIVKHNPLRRRSTVTKAEEQLAFAQRMEKKGGLGQPPPFDPQYLGGVKPPASMVSLAGTEQGWVSVPGEDEKRNDVVVVAASPPRVVVDGPSVSASAAAKGGRGKGGPGWYAGKRKNEKGEIVAIGEDGVEIVIMKLPIKAKAPTPPRPSVRSPSPHPAPSIPLPPIPTFTAKAPPSPPPAARATTPVSEDISDDLPSTLIRELLSRSSSRASGDGSGYFDVYKERISSEFVGPRPVSVLSVASSTGGGLERRKSSTTSILRVATEIVHNQNEQKSDETLVAPKPSVTIVEEDENQRTPVPGASAIFADDASLSNHPITPSVPARTSSLPSSSPPSPPRRPMAFGTRSPSGSPPSSTPRSSPTQRNSSTFGGGVDDAHLLPGSPSTPTKYTIVAHNASQEVVARDRVVSPQAWAEQVAECHSQEVTLDGPRRESILWEEEGGYTVSASSSTAVAPSSSMVNHTRHRVSISPSFESATSTQASSASSCCFSHHHHGDRGSFSSSSDTCPSSAPTSSFTLASNHSISSHKNQQLHLPPSTSLNSLNDQCHSPSSAGGSSTSERSAAVASHKQALLSLRRLHTLEKDALIFALSESKRALDDSRAENEGLRSEVRELGRMMEEIRRALLEEEAAQSIYGTASAGGGSAVSLLSERLGGTLSTLNSVASSIFPSMNSAGMSRKWSASSGGSGSAGWGGFDPEEEEDAGEMGEMLLSLPLPPMTLPSKRRSVVEVVVGEEVASSGEIRRRL